MQKNDIIELKIEDMGVDGEGIGKYDGMTFFVKDAVLGDEIEARITGGVMIAIPISILFVVMQKFYVEGVTGGAVKG